MIKLSSDEEEALRISMLRVRHEQAMEVVDEAPYWQWICVVDPSTCAECAALDGKVFRYNDPIWQRLLGRIHKGCRCTFKELTERDLKKKKLAPISSSGM